ncbi:MAG: tetratricopeptide repeat protein [Blastocatellia bacterium]
MNQPANILLLVSDPLDASISIGRDLFALQNALRDLSVAVSFDIHVAEADAVQSHLARGDRPRYGALHYLGHGANPDGDFGESLIFENADCLRDPIDPNRLAYVFKGAGGEFPLAVVSACHSESVAASFFAAGAKHVVAIEGSQSVYEVAAIAFCRRFYQTLLTGRSLSESFAFGQDALFTDPVMRRMGNRATQIEASKFKLLNYPGADPARFYLTAASGQTELREPPSLTAHPFDQHPAEFIGRNDDMRDLLAALNTHRAAVVLGVSGVGKTELAKQTARRMVERRRVQPDHVGFAALVNAKTADEARAAIAPALGLPPDGAPDNGALQRAMPRHRLLILDEAENAIARDGLAFRQLLDALISSPGKPIVIVTSQTNPNTPKAPPVQVRRLSELAALRLFATNTGLDWERFQRINREQLLEVLGYVDRLPRAIELIARVWWQERGADPDNLDLTSLLRQLRADRDRVMRDPDYPDEVKSVTVGVQYAYDRLIERSPAAAQLWAQLALFPGGVSKDGLAAIFGAEAAGPANEIEKQSLVESSYDHFPAPFGNLLELPTPFRFFALRHLPAGDEATARQSIGESVLRYYHDFPEEPHRGWVGLLDQRCSGQAMGAFIDRFNAELPSIESWLDWAYDHETAKNNRARAPRLTALLQNLYVVSSVLHRKRDRLNRALACALRHADKEGEANVLQAMGDLQMRVADLAGARESYAQALPIYREIEDRLGEANVRQSLGNLYLAEGDPGAAFAEYSAALEAHTEIENLLGVAGSYGYLGRAAKAGGDHPRAILLIEEAVTIYRRITDAWSEGIVLSWQGESFFELENVVAGLAAMWQARESMRASGNPQAQHLDESFARFAENGDEAKALLDALPDQAEAMRQEAIEEIRKEVESRTEEGEQG